jgi:hypothetical protein
VAEFAILAPLPEGLGSYTFLARSLVVACAVTGCIPACTAGIHLELAPIDVSALASPGPRVPVKGLEPLGFLGLLLLLTRVSLRWFFQPRLLNLGPVACLDNRFPKSGSVNHVR